MKFNKWTLGLAALGVVSLASVAKAEESTSPVQTALATTVISGYVDTSFNWQFQPTDEVATFGSWGNIPFQGSQSKANGFNLNVVKLSIEKPLDESQWAAGYKVDLLFGPDAANYNTSANADGGQLVSTTGSDFAIKQAYVALRTPVGNGIDWKIGVFDTIIGYEVYESGNNPNFTRSWGYAIEPTQHTGLLGTYRVTENFLVAAGIANTLGAGVNARNVEGWDPTAAGGAGAYDTISYKSWMASMALTAPESMGFLNGSTLYAGIVGGFGNTSAAAATGPTTGASTPQATQINYYLGATVNTPVTGLKAGLAFDYVDNLGGGLASTTGEVDGWVVGLYLSYQATEKLSVHGRAEFGDEETTVTGTPGQNNSIIGLTGTVQYNLWENVVSRLELRWDQSNPDTGGVVTGAGAYANVIYKF